MKVRIKKMDGSTFELELNPDNTVQSLKSLVRDHEQVEESRQRLIYHGRVLRDDDILSVYNLAEDSVLHLVVRPEDVPQNAGESGGTAAPVPPVDGPVIQPFQDLGNGMMMGSMTMNADQVQPADLGNIFSQLFSTLGHVATVPGAAPLSHAPQPASIQVAPLPHMPIGPGNINTASMRASRRQQQPVPLRASLEQSVANAEIVVDTARIFQSNGANNSLPFSSSPADIDSPANNVAIAQGLVSFHEALIAMQTPVGSMMHTLRSGGKQRWQDIFPVHYNSFSDLFPHSSGLLSTANRSE